jgi:hypothetical protein
MQKQLIKTNIPFKIEETAPYTLRDDARLEFFRTIKRKKPEIVSSLAQDVLPLYRLLTEESRRFPILWGHLTLPDRDKAYQEACLEVAAAILSWSSNWNLAWLRRNVREDGTESKPALINEFCLDQTIETLNAWCWHGVPNELDWSYTLTYKSYSTYQVQYFTAARIFQFEYPSWPVHADSWKSYEKKLDEAYRAAKKLYHEEQLQFTNVSIIPAAVDKRNPAHFDWLVDYLIEEMTFAGIARKYGGHEGLSERSVSGAIYSLTDLLGLTLPYRRVGRPPKNKTSKQP